ncbi:MAG TPA: ribosome biogenesis/translation initiation ATPase RLI [Candidatus Poseidoniales archaeon]|nr:MAG: ribosome biogenesis/translation initiation ATPase RLI [Euryarchaeota archaeon]HIE81847.1 ribosome biogenesis/translation initiation ATPase RLI [Candidatus Poseidoniales archaeon]HIL50465.1 ribosome biogenesis/translation initiation ATPase RLI [Candidatus Poseidoniales archaeon]
MRVAVLLEDRCQPKKCNAECWAFCPPVRNGIECIVLDDSSGKPLISEPLCIGCGICVVKCPFEALIITNLPEELKGEMTHRYGENGFRLFRLPSPRQEQIVGILGPNGMGKSTAVNLLSGSLRPNLGDWTIQEKDWAEIVESFPRGELRDYLSMVAQDGVKIAVKPQYIDKLPKIFQGEVVELLKRVDDRDELAHYAELLAIDHLLNRRLDKLSGGELQRVAIAATLLKEADVYFFDELSSYLDIHERLRIVRIIQGMVARGKRILVVEHDLAILDVLCDLLHIVYGERAAYGIFTPPRSTRAAINAYLDGYLPEENVRIRDKPIQFLRGRVRGEEVGSPILQWGDMEKTLGEFHLKTGKGEVRSAEVVGVVGPNATGKTTMVRMIAGEIEPDMGWCTMDATVSYKQQHVSTDFDGSVQDWLDTEIGGRWRSGEFHTQVIRPLQVDQLLELRAKKLSGGELQAVCIAICLGKEADLYLLDEPSAHLDANARMEAAKAIRRTMESNEKAAMVIDHDIYFIDIVSDSLLVFDGEGGKHGNAQGPLSLRKGMNRFLADVDVTFRRDHESHRPRINKPNSRKDREQKASGEYFYVE